MTWIYTRASRVVWLGSPDSAGETFNLRKLLIYLALFNPIQGLGISSYDIISLMFKDIDWPFKALGRLFSHSWFERMWVLQEVAVGETVHVMYSGVCVEWDVIATVAKDIGTDLSLSANIVYPGVVTSESSPQGFGLPTAETFEVDKFHWVNAEIIHELRTEYQQGSLVGLDMLLPKTVAFKSKDPRDRIFAILGISRHAEMLPFKPNYKDSVELVYVNTTRFLLSIESWFITLTLGGRGNEPLMRSTSLYTLREVPSWVPDYNCPKILGTRTQNTLEGLEHMDRDGKVIFPPENLDIIQIQAVQFDIIKYQGSKWEKMDSVLKIPDRNTSIDVFKSQILEYLTNLAPHIRDWYIPSRQLARQYLIYSHISQETADNEFWKVCMSGGIRFEAEEKRRGNKPAYIATSPEARKVFELFFLEDPGDWLWDDYFPTVGLSGKEAGDLWGYLTYKFSLTVLGKAFCITEKGSMALVPPLATVNDNFVHIRGRTMPCLLRQKELGRRVADFIGTSYVHLVEDVYSGSDWDDWLLE